MNATPAFDIRLNDPNMDNKLTIKEIVDTVLANPLDLLTTSLGGTGSASFQLSASIGGFSIPASSDTEVTISVPDFSQPENVIVTLPSTAIFDDIANFNNMDAASFASLLGRISNFLDSVRNTRLAELTFRSPTPMSATCSTCRTRSPTLCCSRMAAAKPPTARSC